MKNTIVFVLLILPQFTYSQIVDKVFGGATKKFKYGFSIGYNYSNLLDHKDLASNAKPVNGSGFRLGCLLDYSISQKVAFTPKLDISFNESKLSLQNSQGESETFLVSPTTMEISAHTRVALHQKLSKPYILLGPSFKLPFNEDLEEYIQTRPNIAIDVGLGLMREFSVFRLLPEIRYSIGLLDISKQSNTGTLKNHSVTLALCFM